MSRESSSYLQHDSFMHVLSRNAVGYNKTAALFLGVMFSLSQWQTYNLCLCLSAFPLTTSAPQQLSSSQTPDDCNNSFAFSNFNLDEI